MTREFQRRIYAGSKLSATRHSKLEGEVALHGGGSDALAPPQTAAVDAIEMLMKDGSWKRFAGRQDAEQALARLVPALQTQRFAGFYFQKAVPVPNLHAGRFAAAKNTAEL